MNYPTLLLPLVDDVRAADRLDQAARLARRFESHLVGLSCHRPPPYPIAGRAALLGGDPLSLELERAADLAEARESAFRTHCDGAGLRSHALACDDLEPVTAVVRHAALADLVVLGQADPDDPQHGSRRQFVDDVLLRCARPALVLPYAGRVDRIGGTVLLAWDGSHGAARAATDALPFLRSAQAVHLVRFASPAHDDIAAARASVDAATAWLARHGVQARAQVSVVTIAVGDALLSMAADVGADLLVMGAWGHARFLERLLGGTTRIVADSMTLPVLLSH